MVAALTGLLPDHPEIRGLLAMMLLHDSRRDARFRDGEIVLLGDQDRSRWDTRQVADGQAELDRALALGGRGSYVLQAAIAALHAEKPCDWAQIAVLYGELARLTGSPVVELNRAIAVAETEGYPRPPCVSSTRSASRTSATCTPPGPSSCDGSAGPTRHATPTNAPGTSPTMVLNDASSNAG